MNNANPFQDPQRIIGWIDFPPEEALASAVGIIVVIVVPAFTQREDGQDEGVFARFTRLIAALAKQMAKGIDGKRSVIKNHGANAEAPQESCPARDEVAGESEYRRRDEMILVYENKLREFGQILHALGVILIVIRSEDPAQMRPVKALLLHRVDVIWLIGVLMVMAMMGSPPQRAFLGSHAS